MTCIVGLVENGRVYLGADSAGVANLDLTVRSDAKLFQAGPFAGGFTSSFRMGQLLGYAWKPPKQKTDQVTMTFLVVDVVASLRKLFKDGGYATISNNEETAGQFLLAYAGGLYVVESDYQIGKPADPYAAVGCGAQVAHGALSATAGLGLCPARRLELALTAAERHSAGVRGPFVYLTLEKPDE